MQIKLKTYLLIFLYFMPILPLMAQPGNPAPVGGGLLLLLISGLAIGIIKLRKNKR